MSEMGRSTSFCSAAPLRIQELAQVGLVGGKAVPSGPELPHAVPGYWKIPHYR